MSKEKDLRKYEEIQKYLETAIYNGLKKSDNKIDSFVSQIA